MEQITFETLPNAVTTLSKEIGEIKRLLLERQEDPKTELDELLTVQQAAKLLSLAVPTIYTKVSKGELPVMKGSKRLYFSRAELIDYLKQGKRKTNKDINDAAENYLNGKR